MTKIRQICAWVSLATIGLGALASYSSILRRQPIPGDLNNPILAVEIMHAPSDLYGIVGDQKDPRRTALRRLTEFDCGFIAAYATLFVFVGLLLIQQKAKWTGWAVMLCGLAGAFCDVMENIHIFRALAGQSVTPRYWSLTKWTLIFVTLALLSRVYRTAGEPPLRRFIGFWATFFSILAAVIGLGGIVLKTDPMIESAGNFLGLSLFAGCLFFFTKEPLKTGLCPFLDRVENFQIGGYHPLRRLAEWPSDDVSNDPK